MILNLTDTDIVSAEYPAEAELTLMLEHIRERRVDELIIAVEDHGAHDVILEADEDFLEELRESAEFNVVELGDVL
jgi:hypothetical protein